MAHAVESMMFCGSTPWHGLGTNVAQEYSYDLSYCIKAAGLDTIVEKVPLLTADGQAVPDTYAMRRDRDSKIFGVVGKQYTPLQNLDAFKWFEPFLETKEVSIETAGALHEGEVVWILARIQGDMTVAPGDDIAKFLLLSHSHSGRLKVKGQRSRIRVVCANTLAQADKDEGTETFLKVKHSKGMVNSLAIAREQVAKANNLFLQDLEAYRFLASKSPTTAQVVEYYQSLLVPKAGIDIPTRSQNRIDRAIEVFESGYGQNIASIKGTWWAAYNGMTQILSHEAGRTQDNRLESLWFDGSKNEEALQLALTLAS